jgi:hypothetical protein
MTLKKFNISNLYSRIFILSVSLYFWAFYVNILKQELQKE